MAETSEYFFGDSITQFGSSILYQGWTAGLQDYYSRAANLVNHGYAGYTFRTYKIQAKKNYSMKTFLMSKKVLY